MHRRFNNALSASIVSLLILAAPQLSRAEGLFLQIKDIAHDSKRICVSLLKAWTFKKPKLATLETRERAQTIRNLDQRLEAFAIESDIHSFDHYDWAQFLLDTSEHKEATENFIDQKFSMPRPLRMRLLARSSGSDADKAVEITPAKKALLEPQARSKFEIASVLARPPKSPEDIFATFKSALLASPRFAPARQTLVGATDLLKDMIFGDTDDSYANGGSTSEANYGLISYTANQLETDLELLEAAIHFYTALRFYDGGATLEVTGGAFQMPSVLGWERHQIDVWKLALEACNEDVVLALRVLTVFGHDDIKQKLPAPKNPALASHFKLLNSLMPTRQSQLYFPGAIPGLDIPQNRRAELDRLHEEYQKLYTGEDAHDDEKYRSCFRAGYYHFIGGIYTGTELTRHGFGKVSGVKLPVLLAEHMGYFYKKITMLNTYMSDDARTLYSMGLRKQGDRFKKPADWEEKRYRRAKFEVELSLFYLDFGAYQHRSGANWAFEQIVEYTKKQQRTREEARSQSQSAP